MKWSLRGGMAFVMLAFLGAACSSDMTSTTAPTTPTPTTVTITETFQGNLNQNGAATYSFGVAAGAVTATLTSLGPDSPLAIGMGLGTLISGSCAVAIANDNAMQGAVVSGTVSSAGTVCLRVYDVGNIVRPLAYSVDVVHPQ